MFDKDTINKEYSESYTLLRLSVELYKKSCSIHNIISNDSHKNLLLPELKLAEMYSDFAVLRSALYIYDNAHYEFNSLISFWEEFYRELVLVIERNDRNTSWEHSRFENYSEQHDIVVDMLTNHLDSLKKQL